MISLSSLQFSLSLKELEHHLSVNEVLQLKFKSQKTQEIQS